MVICHLVIGNHCVKILWSSGCLPLLGSIATFLRKERSSFALDPCRFSAARFLRILRAKSSLGISGKGKKKEKKERKKERKEDGTHLLLESCFLVVVTTSPPITRNIAICRFINPSIREAYELTRKNE